MRFQEILKEERQKANLKQSELGEKVGLKAATVCMYERGEREPKIDILIALAEVFDVSLDYLVGREPQWGNQNSFLEEHLLEMFRELSNDDKEKVLAITKTLHEMNKKSGCEKQIG